MTVKKVFAHGRSEAEAVARLAAGVAKLRAEHGASLKAPPTFSDAGRCVHVAVGRSGAAFDLTVTVDPANVTIAGTENLIGHLSEGYLLGIVEDFFH